MTRKTRGGDKTLIMTLKLIESIALKQKHHTEKKIANIPDDPIMSIIFTIYCMFLKGSRPLSHFHIKTHFIAK